MKNKIKKNITAPLEPIGEKRLFTGLITGASLLLSFILCLGWFVPYFGFTIYPAFTYLTASVLLLILLFVFWASLGLILQISTGSTFFGRKKSRALAIKLFLPISEILAKLLNIDQQRVRRSFIQVNNEMTILLKKKYKAEEILILLPHCIQNNSCPIRVSLNIKNCTHCGKCEISSLINLAKKYNVNLAIATGGTIARRIVVEKKPSLILAIACERDLASGIQDTYPLPVYGILNKRPQGPCINTRVQLSEVKKSIEYFIF